MSVDPTDKPREFRVTGGFTLRVEADTTVALVGSSGCGKSTTLALLLRFYDPAEGSITIDGHSVGSLDPSWLRGHMSFVQQEPLLFGVSVRENVACRRCRVRTRSPQIACNR